MVAVASYGSAQNKTAAGTVAFTTTALIPASTLLVIGVCADNTSATAPTITSITAVGGGTWTNQAGSVTQSGATSTAGAGVFVYCQTLFTSSSVASGTSITVTFNASPTAKAVQLWGFSGMSNTLRNTVVAAASTAGTPSAVTAGTALVAGDVVIGIAGAENSAIMTGAADTLNGSWSTLQGTTTTGSTAATNTSISMQWKQVTATGAQTFNPTGGVADSVAIVFAMVPANVAPTARTISGSVVSGSQINLTWAADTAAFPTPTYDIYRSTNGSSFSTIATGQVGQTGYNATGLTAGTSYWFKVTGNNAAGSSTSNTVGPLTPYPKTSTLIDTFDTSINSAVWVNNWGATWDPSGRVKCAATAAYTGISTGQVYDFTESSLFARVNPSPECSSVETILAVIKSNNDGCYMSVTDYGRTLVLRRREGGTNYDTYVNYDISLHAWLRMRMTGTTFLYDTSSDGITWTNRGGNQTTALDMTSCAVSMQAGHWQAEATDPNSFIDNINTPVATPKISTLVDTFDTQINHDVWQATRSSNNTAYWANAVWSAGQAQLTTLQAEYEYFAARSNFDLTNSAITIKLTPPTIAVSREMALRLSSNQNNDDNAYMGIIISGGTRYILARNRVGGVNNDNSPWYTYDPVTCAYWRIRLTSGTLYYDVSPDGTTWTNIWSRVAGGTLTSVIVFVECGQWQTEADVSSGYIDNVNYTVPSRTGQPKYWNGTAWVNKPAKYYNGTAWVVKPAKVWNGTSWVLAK